MGLRFSLFYKPESELRIQTVQQAFESEWDSHNNSDPNNPDSLTTIWVFWKRDTWKADTLLTHPQFIHQKLTNIRELNLYYTSIYGKKSRKHRTPLWEAIQQLGPITSAPWLLGGEISMKSGPLRRETK